MTKLGRIKRETIIAMGVIVSILVVLAGFALVISPYLSSGVKFEEEKLAALNARQLEQSEYDSFAEYQAVHAKTLGVSETVSLSFPTSAEVDDLTRQIIEAAEAAGLTSTNVSNITTTAPIAKTTTTTTEDGEGNVVASTTVEPVARMEVSIVASGSSQQVIDFVSNLAQMERAVLVSSVNYSIATSTGAESRVSLSAISYLYEPLVDPALAPEDVEGVEGEQDAETPAETPQEGAEENL